MELIDLQIQHSMYTGNVSVQHDLTAKAGILGNKYQMRRCNTCKLEFSDPLKSPSAAWYGQVYSILSNMYPSSRWEFDVLISLLGGASRVGEIGCGSGEFLKACRSAGISAMGIDFSTTAVSAALSQGLSVSLMELGPSDLAPPTSGDRTDVVALQVLEHLENPQMLFDLAAAWCGESANLWISVPSPNRPSRFFGEVDYLDQPPHHLTRWSVSSLEILGSNSGWTLEAVSFEPISFRAALWWFTTRSMFYRLLSSRLGKSTLTERAVRLVSMPISIASTLRSLSKITGQTMMAKYRKANSGRSAS